MNGYQKTNNKTIAEEIHIVLKRMESSAQKALNFAKSTAFSHASNFYTCWQHFIH